MAPPVTRAPSGTVVIGAGPAGLSTAVGLDGHCTVLERRSAVGGLSGSVEMDGAVFDVGGHSFWTPHPEVRRLVFERVPMVEQRRRAVCWHRGAYVDYPFQRHFQDLPDERDRAACAVGLDAADGGAGAAHFGEWLVRRFGRGVAETFLLPYNRKLWARDLATLSTDWVGERVAAPTARAEPLLHAAGRRSPLQDDTVVAYPASGGFGEIARALARGLPDVRLDAGVSSVDVERRAVTCADGTVVPWTRLVSTMPLPELVARVAGVPPDVRESASRLEAVSLRVVFVVVDGPVGGDRQRVYVADPAILPHKVALNHNSSPSLRARPRHGIVAEVSYSPSKPLPEGDPGVVEAAVVRNLLDLGLLTRREDVLRTASVDVKHAYPVPTPARVAAVAAIRAWLRARAVHLVGRLAEWDYVNSDECIHRGLALGRSLAEDLVS